LRSVNILLFILTLSVILPACAYNKVPTPYESNISVENSNEISDLESNTEINASEEDNTSDESIIDESIDESSIVDITRFNLLSQFTDSLDEFTRARISENFINWISENCGPEVIDEILSALENNIYDKEQWYKLTGNTITVLYDKFNATNENIIQKQDNGDGITSMIFTGDISLADNWYNIKDMVEKNKTISDYIDSTYINEMVGSDITLVNNEFTISEQGEPLTGKKYVLRASPERLKMYKALGVDIVSLANNHVYDYGKAAFLDTLNYLKSAGIPYIGAGINLSQAMQPQYYIINGRKIAFVAANRSEKYIYTPAATDNSPGVLRCYDTALLKYVIQEARQNADYLFVYVHWGTEFSHNFDEIQQVQGYEYIDAGADAVIGSHSHCLQGVEFYKGKPIIYGLGNFWFSGNSEELGVLKIVIDDTGKISFQMLIGKEDKFKTVYSTVTSKANLLDFLKNISKNVYIDEAGMLTPLENHYSFSSNITDDSMLNKLQQLSDYTKQYSGISIYYKNADGLYYSYNADVKYITASTIKGPFSLYILMKADEGKVSLDTMIELKAFQIWRGGGVIKNSPVGTEYSIRQLIEYAIIESDNTAYKMLVDYFGVTEFNQYVTEKGLSLQLIEGNGYGYCTASEMAELYLDIYNYKGKNADFLIDCLLKTKYSVQIQQGITEYPVAEKYGCQGGIKGYHDVAIVYSPTTFVLSIFTLIDAESENSAGPFIYISEVINDINTALS